MLHETQTFLDSTCFSILHEDVPPSRIPHSSPLCHPVPFIQPLALSPHHVTVPRMLFSGQEQVLNMAEEIERMRVTAAGTWLPLYRAAKPNAAHPQYAASGSSQISCVVQFNNPLRKHLAGDTLDTNTSFIDQLLPHERLPFSINQDTLRRLSASTSRGKPIWNEARCCFSQLPKDFGEGAICDWLNSIGNTLGSIYGRQCERLWWSGSCGKPLTPESTQRTLDLILLDRSYYNRILEREPHRAEWAFVKALVEVQSQTLNVPVQLIDMISAKSYLTFLCQPHHRFAISLSFINTEKTQFSITVTDHSDQIRVKNMDLLRSSAENGLILLSVLAFLMFGSSEDIGLNPHFEMDPSNGQVVAIECEKHCFEVVKRIHALQSLFGRGTQVRIVTHDSERYILKDSWVQEDHSHNEVAHLHKMRDHKELDGLVPTLICGGDVVINGVKDSTRHYRSAPCYHRIHHRIVTSPVGEPITSFKSKKEFICIMISIIKTHRYLYDCVGILHCDLSVSNVLINRKDNDSEPVGILIDYDHSINVIQEEHASCGAAEDTPIEDGVAVVANALDISEECAAFQAQGQTPRMGTPPYMTIEALLEFNPNFIHKPQHDLESMLYVIFYVCTFVRGPGLLLNKSDTSTAMSLPIHTWFSNDEIRDIGYRKLAHLSCYHHSILPNFTPYWHDFAPFVKDLIVSCFPVTPRFPNEMQYERVLQILEKAYDTVEEPLGLTNQVSQALVRPTKRANSSSLSRDPKKARQA